MAPPSSGSSPAIAFNRLDFPDPFLPISAIRSPASIRSDAFSNSGRCPKARETESRVSSGNAEGANAEWLK